MLLHIMSGFTNWFWSVSPLVWAGALLGVAILLVILGLRGRRVGREPRCRRCGYELTGLQSANCPECGRVDVLKRPRIGARRRRWRLLCAGTVVLLAIGSTGAWMLADSNWRVVAPAWLLIAAFEGKDDLSGTELDARINRGSLTESERARIIRYALGVQASAPLASSHLAASFKLLQSLDSLDQLDDEQWLRMLKQSLRRITVRARPCTRVGDPLLVDVDGDLAGPPFLYVELHMSGFNSPAGAFAKSTIPLAGPRSPTSRERLLRLPHDLSVGPHEIDFEFTPRPASAFGGGKGRTRTDCLPSRRGSPPPSPPALVAYEPSEFDDLTSNMRQTVRVAVRVAPAGTDDDIEPITGDDIRSAVQAAFKFEFVKPDEQGDADASAAGRGLRLRLVKNNLPWPILYDVVLRQGDRRIQWGTFSKRPESPQAWHSLWRRHVEGLEAGPVCVELKPRPQDARKMLDARVVAESIELGPVDYVPFQPTSNRSAERVEQGR